MSSQKIQPPSHLKSEKDTAKNGLKTHRACSLHHLFPFSFIFFSFSLSFFLHYFFFLSLPFAFFHFLSFTLFFFFPFSFFPLLSFAFFFLALFFFLIFLSFFFSTHSIPFSLSVFFFFFKQTKQNKKNRFTIVHFQPLIHAIIHP